MGLFGRDDRTSEAKPVSTQPAARPQPSSSSATAEVTLIARSNRLEGTILGPGDVRIEGEVNGAVATSGKLLVAEGGLVEGKVSARNVTVAGAVVGDIAASERIQLNASAKVEGNITAPRILITDGATFDGQVLMKEPGKPEVTTSSARRPEAPSPDKDAKKEA